MSAKKGAVEDTNEKTIRFRKIIASHGIDDPQQLYNTGSLSIEIAPCPIPL